MTLVSEQRPAAPRPLWPLDSLRLRAGGLTLLTPRPAQLDALAGRDDVSELGDDRLGAWTQLRGRDFAISTLQYHARSKAEWTPAEWVLNLIITRGPIELAASAEPLGAVSLRPAAGWPSRRELTTGSWLYPERRGLGIGTVARSALLSLAFDHLGAELTRSAATPENAASLRVSEKLGYRDLGSDWEIADPYTIASGATVSGVAKRVRRLELRREEFRPVGAVEVSGLGLEMFGL